MMRSLFSGVAGLRTHQSKMDVIGNNIANVNTVGYKSASVTFQDLMYQTTQSASGANAETGRGGVNARQIGLGVTTGAISNSITTAGASQSTGNPFDIQIKGDSFFVVSDGSNNFFTRAGAFYVDGQGNLAMTSNGYTVMGWQEDPNNPGTIVKDTVTALKIMSPENLTSEPEQTKAAYLSGIIDKNSEQLSSSDGLIANISLYDNLGYSYMAKTSITQTSVDGIYKIKPTELLDGDGEKLLKQSAIDQLMALTNNNQNPDAVSGVENAVMGSTQVTLGGTIICCKAWNEVSEVTTTKPVLDADGNPTYDADGNPITEDVTEKVATVRTAYFEAGSADDPRVEAGETVDPASVDTYIVYDTTNGKYLGYATGDIAAIDPKKLSGEDIIGINIGGITAFSEKSESNQTNAEGRVIGGGNHVDLLLTTSTCYDNKGTSTIKSTTGNYDGNYAGRKVGDMSGVSIQTDGKIYASYTNGTTRLLGQIAVATFANPSGLEKQGENLYSATQNSGQFDGIGVDITSVSGAMSTGVLEMSNVDLSAEFTEMITTQRGFQANSRIITVSDTMLEELTNLKR